MGNRATKLSKLKMEAWLRLKQKLAPEIWAGDNQILYQLLLDYLHKLANGELKDYTTFFNNLKQDKRFKVYNYQIGVIQRNCYDIWVTGNRKMELMDYLATNVDIYFGNLELTQPNPKNTL